MNAASEVRLNRGPTYHRTFWFLAAVVWTAGVLALALNPTYKGGWLLKTFGDKVLHASAFTVGCLVWAKAAETVKRLHNLWSVVVGAVLALVVGVAIELLQRYVPGRSPDYRDFIADCLGVLPALIYLTMVGLKRYRKSA